MCVWCLYISLSSFSSLLSILIPYDFPSELSSFLSPNPILNQLSILFFFLSLPSSVVIICSSLIYFQQSLWFLEEKISCQLAGLFSLRRHGYFLSTICIFVRSKWVLWFRIVSDTACLWIFLRKKTTSQKKEIFHSFWQKVNCLLPINFTSCWWQLLGTKNFTLKSGCCTIEPGDLIIYFCMITAITTPWVIWMVNSILFMWSTFLENCLNMWPIGIFIRWTKWLLFGQLF